MVCIGHAALLAPIGLLTWAQLSTDKGWPNACFFPALLPASPDYIPHNPLSTGQQQRTTARPVARSEKHSAAREVTE